MRLRKMIQFLLLILVLSSCSQDPESRKQQLLTTANKYFESGKFKEASIIYRRALQQDRRFGEAYYRLGLAEKNLGRYSPAVAALTRATELQPGNEDAYANLADLYLQFWYKDPENRESYLREINRLTERAEAYFPNSFDVLRVQGFVAYAAEDFAGAVAKFRRALELNADSPSVAAALAECLEAIGEFEEAELLARSYIEKHPAEPALFDFLYSRLFRRNRRDEALQVLQSKCEKNPDVPLYRVQLARHYLVVGDPERMDQVIEDLLSGGKELTRAYSLVGMFLTGSQQFARAAEIYERAAAAIPDERTQFRNRMVEVLAIQGRRAEAFELVEQVLEEDRDNAQALALRGALQLRAGNKRGLEAAIRDFESVLTRMPDNVVLRHNLAEAYLAYGNRDRAILEFREAIDKRPDYVAPRYGLARVYLMGQDFARAVAAAEEILKIRPNDEQAQLIRAFAWVSMGEQKQARAVLEQLVDTRPESRESVYQLGRLNLMEGKIEEAAQLFRKLAEGKPPDRRGILGLVQTHVAQGRGDEGLKLIQDQIDEAPDDLWWRRAMGTAAFRAQAFDRAGRELLYVLERQPEDQFAHKQLAGVYFHGQQLSKAEHHFQRAAELNPSDPTPFLYLGIMRERRGELQEAAIQYEKVVELSPSNEIALNNLAYILVETTADLDRALTLAQRARSLSPQNHHIADTLGWIYIKKNLNDSAIHILEDLVSQNPGHVTWRYHLAMALYQKGDHARARRELQTALRNKPTREEENNIRRLLAKASS